jgi:hypothetical protein
MQVIMCLNLIGKCKYVLAKFQCESVLERPRLSGSTLRHREIPFRGFP